MTATTHDFRYAFALVAEQLPKLRGELAAGDSVIFASGRRVVVLDARQAYDMARLLGVYRPAIEHMRKVGNVDGRQWVIAVDGEGRAAAFQINLPALAEKKRTRVEIVGACHV